MLDLHVSPVDDQTIDQFYAGEDIFLEEGVDPYANEFIMLVSNANEKKSALARYINPHVPLGERCMNIRMAFGAFVHAIKSKPLLLDILMNPEIPIVSLVGRAGCGKTLVCNRCWNGAMFGVQRI